MHPAIYMIPLGVYFFISVVLLIFSRGNAKTAFLWPYYLIRMWMGKKDFEKTPQTTVTAPHAVEVKTGDPVLINGKHFKIVGATSRNVLQVVPEDITDDTPGTALVAIPDDLVQEILGGAGKWSVVNDACGSYDDGTPYVLLMRRVLGGVRESLLSLREEVARIPEEYRDRRIEGRIRRIATTYARTTTIMYTIRMLPAPVGVPKTSEVPWKNAGHPERA